MKMENRADKLVNGVWGAIGRAVRNGNAIVAEDCREDDLRSLKEFNRRLARSNRTVEELTRMTDYIYTPQQSEN